MVLLIPLLMLVLASGPALANDDVELNRVEFQVQVDREVGNDLARAMLVVEGENHDPARLAAEINRTMAWALEQAKGVTTVQSRSADYRSFPVYDQRRITQWRASQELVLESTDIEALNTLIGRLQQRLQVRSMAFLVSPERRREVLAALDGEAIDEFRRRAGLIAERLGAGAYDIVQLQISDDGGRLAPPSPLLARTLAVAEDMPVASEPGTSRLGIGIHALIRLRD